MSDIQLGITFFSLAYPFAQHRLDMESCMALSRELGFDGIELVSPQMVRGYPTPDEDWCREFRHLTQRYGLQAFSYGSYVDMTRFPGRDLTEEEIFETSLLDLETAAKLGFSVLKSQCSMPVSVLRRLAPIARKLDIWIGLELHAPNNCHDEIWTPLFQVFDDIGTDVVGVVPDTGIFAAHPHKLFLDAALRSGVSAARLDEITQLHRQGKTAADAAAAMGAMTPVEQHTLLELYREFTPAPLKDLDRMLPYSRYMHGKYFYIDKNLQDPCVPFAQILEHMKAQGFHGAISAEYEGYFTEVEDDPIEQVRRYAAMLNRMLRKEETVQ
jgi:sugar phosphate isomerase/epimerase